VAALVTGTCFGLIYRLPGALLGGGAAVGGGGLRAHAAPSTRRRACSAPAARACSRLHLPLLRRSALAAALLVFVDVMKELPATLVLRPFGSDTLAVVAYNFARDERLGEAALPSLAIVAVGLIPVVLLSPTVPACTP
jgi:iron(III) transport system permease protein